MDMGIESGSALLRADARVPCQRTGTRVRDLLGTVAPVFIRDDHRAK